MFQLRTAAITFFFDTLFARFLLECDNHLAEPEVAVTNYLIANPMATVVALANQLENSPALWLVTPEDMNQEVEVPFVV